jgi:hypothetical protein
MSRVFVHLCLGSLLDVLVLIDPYFVCKVKFKTKSHHLGWNSKVCIMQVSLNCFRTANGVSFAANSYLLMGHYLFNLKDNAFINEGWKKNTIRDRDSSPITTFGSSRCWKTCMQQSSWDSDTLGCSINNFVQNLLQMIWDYELFIEFL